MLTLQEAATKAGVSEKTLRRAISSKALVAHQRETGGSHNNQPFMIAEQDLEIWIASRQPQTVVQPDSVDPGLAARITELEQTVQRLQADAVSDQGYTHNRLDHYGQQLTSTAINLSKLEQTVARVQEQAELYHKLACGRIDALERQVRELTSALQETQDMVARLSANQLKTVFPVEIHEFAKRHGVPWPNIDAFALRPVTIRGEECLDERGQTLFWQLYHDIDAWTPCPNCPHGNVIPASQKEISVPAPDEGTFELADFTLLMQHEYRSSATRGDVRAWLTLRPEPQGIEGDYRVDYYACGRADGKKGPMGREQQTRGEQLKSDLRAKVRSAAFTAGWQKGPHDIFVCPKPEGKS